jgi:UDP-N-acetyl-D-glucosamine/UDP-N-acetyl-D-galactosamine dehydrogenase
LLQKNIKTAVLGAGYVGLPLSLAISQKKQVIVFDTDKEKIHDLKNGVDKTLEFSPSEIIKSNNIKFTDQISDLIDCNFFIIAVPTPIDKNKRPDLKPLLSATKMVGGILKSNDIVIYESTVFPGCTEDVCAPVLERISGLKFNKDFFCGYSPERINPGDKTRKISDIIKVTSGSNKKTSLTIDNFYKEIISAGTYCAENIKVAEAAKVIENTQRDLNISLINELSIIFDLMGIKTSSVLNAASTKWNFLNFKPGLVGGHCIGIDPYYLTHKSQELGYEPRVILAGRKINDDMAKFVAQKFVKGLVKKDIIINQSRILILGVSFKEDCNDIRNTKVIDLISELCEFGCKVDVYDPCVDHEEVKISYNIQLKDNYFDVKYDGIILAVGHKEFHSITETDLQKILNKKSCVMDLKSVFKFDMVDLEL